MTEWEYGFTSVSRSFFTSSSGMSSSRWLVNKTHVVRLPRNKGIASFDTSVDRLVHNLDPNGDAYPVSSLRHGQSMSGWFRMRRLTAMWMQKHATRTWFAKYEISQVLSSSGKVAVTRGLRLMTGGHNCILWKMSRVQEVQWNDIELWNGLKAKRLTERFGFNKR